MKIEVTVPIVNDEKVFNKSLEISKYNNLIELFSYENEYINTLRIDILMVYDEGEYESYNGWYKLRKPKYIESDKKLIIETFLKNKELDIYVELDDKNSFRILSNIVLNLIEGSELPKKLKNINKGQFKADIEQFFKEQDLI